MSPSLFPFKTFAPSEIQNQCYNMLNLLLNNPTNTYNKTCYCKNSIVKGKVLLNKQVKDKNNADSLGHIEQSMLERVKHDQNCCETDDIVYHMITS